MNLRSSPSSNASQLRLPLANASCLALLWLFESRVGEAFWISGALCYIPQHLALLPTLALLAWALREHQWKAAGAYALTLLWVAHVFVGLQIPSSTWRRAQNRPRLRLRAMAYNILGGQNGIGSLAATIRAQKPDVLFLEEAVVERAGDPDPVALLHAALPGYFEARAGEVCIFSRFPVLAQTQHGYPYGAGSNRFILEAMLDVRGVPVRVLGVHPYTITFSDPNRSFPQRIAHSLGIRNRQISTMLGIIEHAPSTWKPAWRKAPLLVGGDFNTPPRGRNYNALAAKLGDSWREAGWGMGNSYSAALPVVRIDYIWHSPQWTATRAEVINSRASDHRPLVADLELS